MLKYFCLKAINIMKKDAESHILLRFRSRCLDQVYILYRDVSANSIDIRHHTLRTRFQWGQGITITVSSLV